jgi:phospholipid/cholesterol/gamma-HCH transport system substrate-binding protein
MISLLKTAEFKVGVLVIAVGSLIGVMSIKVSDNPTLGGSRKIWMMAPNANGLVKNSAIRMAGIPIGVISEIKLEEGQAKIEMAIRKDVDLTVSSTAEMKSNGILGDKYIELTPGKKTDSKLEDGGQITTSNDKGSLDSVLSQVGDVASSLKVVADRLKESVDSDGTNKHILGRIVQNVEKLTGDFSDIASNNKEDIRNIIKEIKSVASNINEVVGNPDSGLKKSWGKLDRALSNLEQITAKINNGEGTVGRLINDDKTVDELNNAIQGVSGFFDSANKMQTAVDFHSEYLGQINSWKSYIGLKLTPGLDRYYLLQIVDDPIGVVEKTDTSTLTNGTGPTVLNETKTYHNKVKLNLLFAKNFYDFTIKGGLIENSGGFGFDYHFFKQRLMMSLEAFEFTNMNLRASAKYNIYKGVYLVGGVSDVLNKSGKNSSYVGAGLFLTNDDVKFLMSKVPL